MVRSLSFGFTKVRAKLVPAFLVQHFNYLQQQARSSGNIGSLEF